MNSPLSTVHKDIHVASLAHAARMRGDGAAHARLLSLARDARIYFSILRTIGE
jgi:hypothetical protein